MIRRLFATWAFPVSAGLAAFAGCGQNNVDLFGGVVDAGSFDVQHSPNTDVDEDGVSESLFPKQGYVNGEIVQYFDFGQVPAFKSEGTDAFGADFSAFVTKPNLMFRMNGACEPITGKVKFEGVTGFDYDPRFEAFSPFRHHEILEFLPDGSDEDGDGVIDYNPIQQVIDVTVPDGTLCNEVISVSTLRKRIASEDLNGNGVLDTGEDLDLDGRIDDDLRGDLIIDAKSEFFTNPEFAMFEAFDVFTRLPDLVLTPVPDPQGIKGRNFGFLRFDPDGFSEDLDIDLNFDGEPEVDVDGDGNLDDEDLDQDGRLDVDEDVNGDRQLNAGEDQDGDNRLDVDEDENGNGALDVEDFDHDGFRDCGEVLTSDCVEAEFGRAPVTEDADGDGILDAGEDGSTTEFGAPNGVLDTEDLNGDGVLSNSEDLNGDGVPSGLQGGIPAYDDRLAFFFNTFLLHVVEFRPPTVEKIVLQTEDLNQNGTLDAGEDNDADGILDELSVTSVETMRMFVDQDDADLRPIFEFAPGEAGFQPLAEVVFYVRNDDTFLPGELSSFAELQAADGGAIDILDAADELPGVVVHVGFARSGAAEADPAAAGDSVFFRDSDQDGLPDFIEELLLGSDSLDADTDGDGLDDGEEDRNRDGELEAFESDPTKVDTDGDTISDINEINVTGTDPNAADTDGDGRRDNQEDANANGTQDAGETDPLDADSDNDGLTDGVEFAGGTNPLNPNTDGDCFTDKEEKDLGSDATDVNSPVQGGNCN